MRRVTNSLRKARKRGLSYRKKTWEFRDYPITVREQKDVPESSAAEGKPLPRPGADVPLKIASQDRIHANDFLANDFIERILNLPCALITDGSSLWDFHTGTSNEEYFAKIKGVYFVDVSDIESGNIADILDRIAPRRAAH